MRITDDLLIEFFINYLLKDIAMLPAHVHNKNIYTGDGEAPWILTKAQLLHQIKSC